jgi:hypothetical protein
LIFILVNRLNVAIKKWLVTCLKSAQAQEENPDFFSYQPGRSENSFSF